MGLWYPKDTGFELTAFSDSDHAGCLDSRKSTSGGIQFLGGHRRVIIILKTWVELLDQKGRNGSFLFCRLEMELRASIFKSLLDDDILYCWDDIP
ncbi:hypothetical protein Tco_0394291 [Tanacetum coccineum]